MAHATIIDIHEVVQIIAEDAGGGIVDPYGGDAGGHIGADLSDGPKSRPAGAPLSGGDVIVVGGALRAVCRIGAIDAVLVGAGKARGAQIIVSQ